MPLVDGRLVKAVGEARVATITPSNALADLRTDYVAGDVDTPAEVAAAINATNTRINQVLAVLREHKIIQES